MTSALASGAPALFDAAELERSDGGQTLEQRLERSSGGLTLEQRLERSSGGLTLEQRLDRVWEGLVAVGAASCPLCGDPMSGQRGRAAQCAGCGSKLA